MSKSVHGWLAAILVGILWGTPAVLGKFVLKVINFPSLVILQYLTALIILGVVLFIKQKKPQKILFSKGNLKDLSAMALGGVVGHGAFTTLSFFSLKYISAAENGIIQATIPLLILLVAIFFYHERFTKGQVVAGMLAFVGIVLLVMDPELEVQGFQKGHYLCFLGALSFASCAHKRAELSKIYGPIHTMFYQNLFAFLASLLFLFHSEVNLYEIFILYKHPDIILMIAFIGGGVTALSYLVYIFSMEQIGVEKTGIALNLIPISSFFFGVLLLGEEVTITRVLAILIVVTSVVFFELLSETFPFSFGFSRKKISR